MNIVSIEAFTKILFKKLTISRHYLYPLDASLRLYYYI